MNSKSLLVSVMCFLPIQAVGAENSYILMDKVPAFCSGGRFLLKPIGGHIHIWCAVPGLAVFIIFNGANQHIVGITVHDDALEYIAMGDKP